MEPRQTQVIQMDVTSMVVMASIASIVDLQVLEQHPTPAIQISAMKNKGR